MEFKLCSNNINLSIGEELHRKLHICYFNNLTLLKHFIVCEIRVI